MTRLRLRLAGWCLVTAGVLAVPASAIFERLGEPVPVDRLIQNVSRIVAERPKDAEAHYTLGRLNSLAYAKEGAQVPVVKRDGDPDRLPGFGAMDSVLIAPERAPGQPDESAKRHLRDSIREYRRATEIDHKKPLYYLGLGWL